MLLIGALIYFFAFADNDDTIDDVDDMANDTTEDIYNNGDIVDTDDMDNTYDSSNQLNDGDSDVGIAAYKSYIDNPKMGLDHVYTNGALLTWGVDISADLAEAKMKAKDIKEDPYEVDHANKIRNSGEIIAKVLKTIQTEKFPNLASTHQTMKERLMKIKPDEKTLNQKEDVKNFFGQAADLLTQMKQ